MSENLENYKKKEERIKQYFYEYNQSIRELILSGEDANSLLFHDFLKDLKPDEINLLKKNTFPSIARLNVLNAIYSVSILSVEDRRLLKEKKCSLDLMNQIGGNNIIQGQIIIVPDIELLMLFMD